MVSFAGGAPGDFEQLAALRQEYAAQGLAERDLPEDPLELFGRWFDDVLSAGLPEPNAMVVASTGADGAPSSRLVLLKGVVDGALCFYTNLDSRKGAELRAEPRCALLFPWYPLQRQVRIEGEAREVDRARVEAYFATRPRAAQLGAWASAQSRPVGSREELEAAYARLAERFADQPVPCPPRWGGFLVHAEVIEFWQGRVGRMHDRLVYRRSPAGWATERLAP